MEQERNTPLISIPSITPIRKFVFPFRGFARENGRGRSCNATLNLPLASRFPWSRFCSRRPPRSSRKWLGRRIRSPRTLQPPYCSVHGRDPARMLSRTTDTSGSVRPLAGTDSIVLFSNSPPLPFELEMRHLEGHEGGSCTATESNLSRPEVAEWSAEDVELRSACKRKEGEREL